MEEDDYAIPDFDESPQPAAPAGVPGYVPATATPAPLGDTPTAERAANNVAGYLTASSGEQYFLKPGINVIGRGEVDFQLSDKAISRRHCVLEVTPDGGPNRYGYILCDIGALEGTPSRNGVYVDRRTLRLGDTEKVIIYHGTRIEIGRIFLQLNCES